MKSKQITAAQAASYVKDGMTIMFGGFVGCGTAHHIVKEIVKSGAKDLTLICNDPGKIFVDAEGNQDFYGISQLFMTGQVKKFIASHIGIVREVGAAMNAGTLDVELVPQGTLAERIRCGGAGLGGFYTRTGVGTEVAEGKEVREIDGKDYVLEMPLRAEIAFLGVHKIDKYGNAVYEGSMRNFNLVMATAADLVIAEADEVVDVINPELVETPGVLVNYFVDGGKE